MVTPCPPQQVRESRRRVPVSTPRRMRMAERSHGICCCCCCCSIPGAAPPATSRGPPGPGKRHSVTGMPLISPQRRFPVRFASASASASGQVEGKAGIRHTHTQRRWTRVHNRYSRTVMYYLLCIQNTVTRHTGRFKCPGSRAEVGFVCALSVEGKEEERRRKGGKQRDNQYAKPAALQEERAQAALAICLLPSASLCRADRQSALRCAVPCRLARTASSVYEGGGGTVADVVVCGVRVPPRHQRADRGSR